MDAVKILGGLLNQRAGRPGTGGGILGQVLNGVAAAAQASSDPRYSGGSMVENLVRDSVIRHQHAGGQLAPTATQWVQSGYGGYVPQGGFPQPGFPQPGYPNMQGFPQPGYPNMPGSAPVVRGAPVPGQDIPRDPQYHQLSPTQRGEILIQAMIMAAQADGSIDADEQNRIVAQLQPLTQQEVEYLRRAFGTRHDIEGFVATIPRGMEMEVYQVSLMAINLDNQRELQYLRNLAVALRIQPQTCNAIHQQYGVGGIF